MKIFAVWEGGLAMHGGIIVRLLAGWRWRATGACRSGARLDVVAPSMVLGQAIGRWGNFFNEEAFGAPTDLPWKLYISPPHRPLEYAQSSTSTPRSSTSRCGTSLVFVLLVGGLRPRLARRIPARCSSAYIGLYSVGRFAIESAATRQLLGRARSGCRSSRAWPACWWRRRGAAGPCGGPRSSRRPPGSGGYG